MNKKSIPIDEVIENVSNRVASSPYPYGLHHSRIAQLFAAQGTIKDERLLQLIGLDASNEKGMRIGELLHE